MIGKEKETKEVELDKEGLINKIKKVNDPIVLYKINSILTNFEANEQTNTYDNELRELLYSGDDANEPCLTRIKDLPQFLRIHRYENITALPVFICSMLMLILAGAIIMLLTGGKEVGQFAYLSKILFYIYSFFWVFFLLDFIITVFLAFKESVILHKGEFTLRLLSLMFPPLRIGSRRITDSNYIWLPIWGWSKANYALFDQLRRSFSLPMIAIALLIIPVLIVEWKFYNLVTTNFPEFNLDLWMQLVQAFIWIAFTFEFILMFSVTNEKVDYCKRNWIDLLIIFLPLISFFRTLRLVRIARLNHLARGYKLRGILMKAKQGMVLADAIQRIIYPNPKIHIRSLHKAIVKNNREREELNRRFKVASERLKIEKTKKSKS